IAAAPRHVSLELGILALADLDVWVDDEDDFAPLCPEAPAPTALASLDEDGVALRRARHREWPSRAEVAAGIVETMHLAGMGKQARRLILDDGIVLPAVPMPEHDVHELVGAVIALVVRDCLVATHVLGFAVVERRHHVPRRTTVGHQIERPEH